MKAKDIMTKAVITVNQQAAIAEIAKTLINNKVSGVPVVDDGNNLVGIVTEGDLLFKEMSPRLPESVNILGAIIFYSGVDRYAEDWKKIMAVQASEIMTEKVVTISENTEIEEISALMVKHGIKRIPVVDGKKIVGIVSRADITKIILEKLTT